MNAWHVWKESENYATCASRKSSALHMLALFLLPFRNEKCAKEKEVYLSAQDLSKMRMRNDLKNMLDNLMMSY